MNNTTDKKLTSNMGENARTYIVEHFSANKVLANFETKVNQLITGEEK